MKETWPLDITSSISPLHDRIVNAFSGMSEQLRGAARFALDHPVDVALMSMRETAKRANVKPATMTRFAKHLGFEGYDAFRNIYADAMRERGLDLALRANEQVVNQELHGDQALARQMALHLSAKVEQLGDDAAARQLEEAAVTLSTARNIYCLGLRSCFPVAWHFHYVLSLVQDNVRLLDGGGATGVDKIRHMSAEDVLLVVSVAPYARATVEIVDYAALRALKIVAITDSAVSPVAKAACNLVRIETGSPSFFHVMAPAFAGIEILAALVTGRGGANALSALQRTEDQLAAFGTHLNSKRLEKSR